MDKSKWRKDRRLKKSPEWIYEEYVVKNRPRDEVAKESGLTIAGFKSALLKYGIVKPKKIITKELLENLVNQKLDYIKIMNILHISQTQLYRLMKKFGLVFLAVPERPSQYDDSNDKEICEMYLNGASSTEIGKHFGTSHRTIINHLDHCNIVRRSLSESQWNYNKKEYPEELKSYESLYDLYVTQHIDKKNLGLLLNCSPDVIDRALKEFGIPVRGVSETLTGMFVGEKHHNWQGGITTLSLRLREYFGIHLVLKTLKRDGWKCQMCGSKKELHVHHIIPFSSIVRSICKEHPDLDPIRNVNELYDIAVKDQRFLDEDNLITYCKECHFWRVHLYVKKLADDKPREMLEA